MFGWLRRKKKLGLPDQAALSDQTASQGTLKGYMHPAGICVEGAQGAVLQGYRLLTEVGGLRYEQTYRARHEKDGRLARVEFRWHGGERESALFRTESERLARFDHPAAARLYAWGETPGDFRLFYRICEEIEGGSLDDWVSPTWQEGLAMFRQLLAVMAALHSQGMMHGNLRRSSIWRTPTGTLRLARFGETTAPEFYSCDADPGDFALMGAEHFQGIRGSFNSEQTQVGLAGYLLLTGRPRYEPAAGADLMQQLAELLSGRISHPKPRDIRPDVPAEVEEIIEKMIALESGDRFVNLAAAAAALQAVKA